MNKSENELLTRHVMTTLPDSISVRKTLLTAVIRVMPRGHERRIQAAVLLRQLEAHEQSQLEFSLSR